MTANDITRTLLLRLNGPDCRAWRRNVVSAKIGNRFIRSSQLPGEADITGILDIAGIGIPLEIEVKAGNDRLRDSQRIFGAMIERMHGIYLVAHDVETAITELQSIKRHLSSRIRSTDS